MDDRVERPGGAANLPGRYWRVGVGVLIGVAVLVVLWWAFSPAEPAGDGKDHQVRAEGPGQTEWTCSMHPEVRLPRPGLCPKCGMRLISVEAPAGDAAVRPRTLTVSPEAKALMDIQTAVVERKYPTAEIRMTGKVEVDETRQANITAWVDGRIERMFINYTGVPVRQGEHMVELYSPELYSAQAELVQALQAARELSASSVEIARPTGEATVQAAREKLRLAGLTDEQIADVERSGRPQPRVTIYAPISGIVTAKNAQEGMYVQTGTSIYALADLSVVWVRLDAYEADLAWLRYGQKAQFTSVSYPGRTFEGVIAFIDPVLNPMTRTVKVRVNVPNAEGLLKPEMFVHAVVRSHLAAEGKVVEPALAGKWICPMHPEVIRDEPGTCDICGMPLVTAESLGCVPAEAPEAPLVIPASAALLTGTRAVVYVEDPNAPKPTYEGREIVLGPRAGDVYIVRDGLREGQRVVTRGNFKIDAALQIQARPSMMSPEGGAAPPYAHGAATGPAAPAATGPAGAPAGAPSPTPTAPAPEHRHG